MNKFEFVRCLKNNIRVFSLFNKMVFNPSLIFSASLNPRLDLIWFRPNTWWNDWRNSSEARFVGGNLCATSVKVTDVISVRYIEWAFIWEKFLGCCSSSAEVVQKPRILTPKLDRKSRRLLHGLITQKMVCLHFQKCRTN